MSEKGENKEKKKESIPAYLQGAGKCDETHNSQKIEKNHKRGIDTRNPIHDFIVREKDGKKKARDKTLFYPKGETSCEMVNKKYIYKMGKNGKKMKGKRVDSEELLCNKHASPK